jgi:hypothetical protein
MAGHGMEAAPAHSPAISGERRRGLPSIRTALKVLGVATLAAVSVSTPADAASLKHCGGDLEPETWTIRATPKVSCTLARKLQRLTDRRTSNLDRTEEFRVRGRWWWCVLGLRSGSQYRTKGACSSRGQRVVFYYVARRIEVAEAEREVIWHIYAKARADTEFDEQFTSPIRVSDCGRAYPTPRVMITCRAEWTGVRTPTSAWAYEELGPQPWSGSEWVLVAEYGPDAQGIGVPVGGVETEWHGDYYIHS